MRDENQAVSHVPPAVQGFFRSVALGQAAGDRTGNLQVCACGRRVCVESACGEGFVGKKACTRWEEAECHLHRLCRGISPPLTRQRHPTAQPHPHILHPHPPPAPPTPTPPQDILRLLTLWFNFGAYAEVRAALTEGFQLVSIDTWLLVIPQIIARIHTHNTDVRQLIHHLLVKIGRHHPQVRMSARACVCVCWLYVVVVRLPATACPLLLACYCLLRDAPGGSSCRPNPSHPAALSPSTLPCLGWYLHHHHHHHPLHPSTPSTPNPRL